MAPQGEPGHVGSHGSGGTALALSRVQGAVGVDEQLETTTKAGTGTGEHLVGRVPAVSRQTAYAAPGTLLRGLIHAVRCTAQTCLLLPSLSAQLQAGGQFSQPRRIQLLSAPRLTSALLAVPLIDHRPVFLLRARAQAMTVGIFSRA